MTRRYTLRRFPNHYVVRNKKGKFIRWVNKRKSRQIDKRKAVGNKRIPKTRTGMLRKGYGHRGDYIGYL